MTHDILKEIFDGFAEASRIGQRIQIAADAAMRAEREDDEETLEETLSRSREIRMERCIADNNAATKAMEIEKARLVKKGIEELTDEG